ncbi:FAD-dependent oxidoreductase [Streptomyces sp. NPDC086519]|uniref:FAD-dependent oxidoreductase n=1 Tax=Streptomyces sp. NPDC086519 TaxID=3154863 RepID=UPI00341A7E3C
MSDLGSIVPRPASKLFLGYDRPWWEDLGLRAGADPDSRNALLLASYNDLNDVEFRNELLARPNRLAPVAVPRTPRPLRATASGPLVDEAQLQLRELHDPEARNPEPTAAYFRNWVQGPCGAAYRFWQVRGEELGGRAAHAPPTPRRQPVRLRRCLVDRARVGLRHAHPGGADA